MSGSGVIMMQLLYSDYLVWSGVSHHQKLFLKMTPAVEDGEDGEEKEDVAPLQQEVVGVESLQGAGGHDPQHHQVERQPGDEVRSSGLLLVTANISNVKRKYFFSVVRQL